MAKLSKSLIVRNVVVPIMNLLNALIVGVAASLVFVGPSGAATYTYDLGYSSPNGTPLEDFLFYAESSTGETEFQVGPASLPVKGNVSLVHETSFQASKVIVFGLAERLLPEGEPEKFDIIVFVNPDFYNANAGIRFGEIFPVDDNAAYPAHRDLPQVIRDARAGDIDALSAFLSTDAAGSMLFNPLGSFTAIQFTPAVVLPPVPLPPTALLMLGACGLLFGVRRRKPA